MVFGRLLIFMSLIVATYNLATVSLVRAADAVSVVEQPSLLYRMTVSSTSLISSFNSRQKSEALYSFDSDVRSEWRYFPESSLVGDIALPSRKGLQVSDLNDKQKEQLWVLLNAGLSQVGASHVSATLEAEKTHAKNAGSFVNKLLFKYGPENYFITFFGTPQEDNWGWRFEGHHVSLNFTIQLGQIHASPVFLGANPAHVVLADGKNLYPLQAVQKSIFTLVKSLTKNQVAKASAHIQEVPKFNVYAPGLMSKILDYKTPEAGLKFQELSVLQRRLVLDVVETYQAHFDPLVAETNSELARKSFDQLEVVWFGPQDLKSPFYFRLQSPAFIFEMMSAENDFDHYHSVWVNLPL